MNTIELICPKHGVVQTIRPCFHHGSLEEMKFCPKCGKPLKREVQRSYEFSYTYPSREKIFNKR